MKESKIRRTHYCGELSKDNVNQNVIVMGWVFNKRVVGKKLAFIDLKDREGILQLIFTKENVDITLVDKISNQSVIWAKGNVVDRKTPNPNLKTGEIELKVIEFGIFSSAEELPFALHGHIDIDEEVIERLLDIANPDHCLVGVAYTVANPHGEVEPSL